MTTVEFRTTTGLLLETFTHSTLDVYFVNDTPLPHSLGEHYDSHIYIIKASSFSQICKKLNVTEDVGVPVRILNEHNYQDITISIITVLPGTYLVLKNGEKKYSP